MPTIEINAKNFILGESSADFMPDKGFSPESYGLNLIKKRGVLYFNEAATARHGSELSGNIIASANDHNYLGNDKYFLDDEGAFYIYSGTTLTKRQTDPSGATWQVGTSDLLQFNLDTYATSDDKLWVLTGSNLDSLDKVGTISLNAGFRHPMEIVEDTCYVGSKNTIYYFNNAGSTGTAFTLPTDVNVTSLRRHPDGVTLLAFCGTTGDLNAAHSRTGDGRVYYCNTRLVGVSAKGWDREVKIESQVEGTRVVGGVVYCTWGQNFGYFHGSGLQIIKRLTTSTVTHSHQISNLEDILMVRDGIYILFYGDLGAGRVWWNAFKNNANLEAINCLAYIGSNKVLVAHKGDSAGTGYLYEQNFNNAGTSSASQFVSNKYFMAETVKADRFDIIHDSSGTSAFNFQEIDDGGSINLIHSANYASQSVRKTKGNMDVEADILQLRLFPVSGTGIGFKYIKAHYGTI